MKQWTINEQTKDCLAPKNNEVAERRGTRTALTLVQDVGRRKQSNDARLASYLLVITYNAELKPPCDKCTGRLRASSTCWSQKSTDDAIPPHFSESLKVIVRATQDTRISVDWVPSPVKPSSPLHKPAGSPAYPLWGQSSDAFDRQRVVYNSLIVWQFTQSVSCTKYSTNGRVYKKSQTASTNSIAGSAESRLFVIRTKSRSLCLP